MLYETSLSVCFMDDLSNTEKVTAQGGRTKKQGKVLDNWNELNY